MTKRISSYVLVSELVLLLMESILFLILKKEIFPLFVFIIYLQNMSDDNLIEKENRELNLLGPYFSSFSYK